MGLNKSVKQYALAKSFEGFSAGTRVDILEDKGKTATVQTRSPVGKFDEKGNLISSEKVIITGVPKEYLKEVRG